MADLSSPFENITSLLGSSSAWQKYFPGITTGAAPSYEGVTPAKTKLPSFKGIDFTTGKPVDLSMYENVSIDSQPRTQTGDLTPPSYQTEASPISDADLDRYFDKLAKYRRQGIEEETAANIAMLDPLQRRVLETAYRTRQWDLANRMQGEQFKQNLPESRALVAGSIQNQLATATGAEAQMLDAVSNAAYRSAMAQAQGLAPRGRAG